MAHFTIYDQATRDVASYAVTRLSTDKRWKVEIKEDKPRRTRSQNNLMWMWIDRAAQALHEETGQDKDDIHELFKSKFCPVRPITVGDARILVRSTKKLTTPQMMQYMRAIEGYCASEWGIPLPIPEEAHRHER